VKDEIRFHPAARAEVVAAAVYLESKRLGYGLHVAEQQRMEFAEPFAAPSKSNPREPLAGDATVMVGDG